MQTENFTKNFKGGITIGNFLIDIMIIVVIGCMLLLMVLIGQFGKRANKGLLVFPIITAISHFGYNAQIMATVIATMFFGTIILAIFLPLSDM